MNLFFSDGRLPGYGGWVSDALPCAGNGVAGGGQLFFVESLHPVSQACLRHAVKYLAEADRFVPDIVVQMQANVPVHKPGVVDRVIQTLVDTKEADIDEIESIRIKNNVD